MDLVETIVEDARWESIGLDRLAEHAGHAVLAQLDLPSEGFQISLLGCDDARIAVLNSDFRGKPQPTNVLSWPSEDRAPTTPGLFPDLPGPGPDNDPKSLGDIAIAWETCVREAEAQVKPVSDHVTHLIVHGILHLFGYDHMTLEDAAVMEALEVRILATLGVSDPY